MYTEKLETKCRELNKQLKSYRENQNLIIVLIKITIRQTLPDLSRMCNLLCSEYNGQ